ncbi:PREDICTED: CD99 antigen [Chaetura pelagica]|uniref:CD99 antigen n=1 Tax=Chaetura pelagica TaxID=8897 RepID=UPI000523C9D7|nr:PREDICTED: CD99 antigen [Chaetura pelagica]
MRAWRLESSPAGGDLGVVMAPRLSEFKECLDDVLSRDFGDFSLEDALEETTKKPLPSKKPPPSDDDEFNLEHALHPDDPKPGAPTKPKDADKPKPDLPVKDTGNLDDSDLYDGSSRKGGADGSGSNERKGSSPDNVEVTDSSQGAIAGIVSAVAATVIGAVSSFIAYQKKKLCFKQSVQRTLLEN